MDGSTLHIRGQRMENFILLGELSVHLKSIIQSKDMSPIPTKSPFIAPARKVLPQLGDQSLDARSLDDKFVSYVEGLEIQARETIQDRESVHEGGIYSECQQPVMSEAYATQYQSILQFRITFNVNLKLTIIRTKLLILLLLSRVLLFSHAVLYA